MNGKQTKNDETKCILDVYRKDSNTTLYYSSILRGWLLI